MAERLRVDFDFDGPVRKTWETLGPYSEEFSKEIANKYSAPFQEVHSRVDANIGVVLSQSGIFGLKSKGVVSVPAEADAFILYQAAVKLFFEDEKNSGIRFPETGEEIEEELKRIHFLVHPKIPTIYQDYADKALRELQATTDFSIITNSKRGKLAEKNTVLGSLAQLLKSEEEALEFNLIGDASKQKLVPEWNLYRQFKKIDTFPGDGLVYLNRPYYYDAMMKAGKGLNPDVAVGDVYHLDLALPEEMGVYTILVASDHTPKYFLDYYRNHPNGKAFRTLGEITHQIAKMRK